MGPNKQSRIFFAPGCFSDAGTTFDAFPVGYTHHSSSFLLLTVDLMEAKVDFSRSSAAILDDLKIFFFFFFLVFVPWMLVGSHACQFVMVSARSTHDGRSCR